MTKRKGALPIKKRHDRSRDNESLLLRSAESLGRVIGALQRQLEGATKRLSAASEASEPTHSLREGQQATRRGTKKRSATHPGAGAKKAKKTARKVTRRVAQKKTQRR